MGQVSTVENSETIVDGATLKRLGHIHLMMGAIVFNLVYLLVMFSMAWTRHTIEAALLWWVPKHIAVTYIEYYLSWALHTPGVKKGRYHRGYEPILPLGCERCGSC